MFSFKVAKHWQQQWHSLLSQAVSGPRNWRVPVNCLFWAMREPWLAQRILARGLISRTVSRGNQFSVLSLESIHSQLSQGQKNGLQSEDGPKRKNRILHMDWENYCQFLSAFHYPSPLTYSHTVWSHDSHKASETQNQHLLSDYYVPGTVLNSQLQRWIKNSPFSWRIFSSNLAS
jgi:hypothetical protein